MVIERNPLTLCILALATGLLVGALMTWTFTQQAEDGPVRRVYDRLDALIGLVGILVLAVVGGVFYAS